MSPRTVGVGFLRLQNPTDPAERRKLRLALLACAEDEGISLADVYEPDDPDPQDLTIVLGVLEELTLLHGARTLVTLGALDEPLLAMTKHAELRVITVPDPGRRRPTNTPCPPSGPWTGPLTFDLYNGRRWRVATVDLDVQAQTVRVAMDGRMLVEMGRPSFGRWLSRPAGLFGSGVVVWSVWEGVTCLEVDGAGPFIVATATVEHLTQVI